MKIYSRSYENHIDGDFILYRNKLYNQEVCFLCVTFSIMWYISTGPSIPCHFYFSQIQTRHKKCHPDYSFPHCTCAVSVQSGQDIHLMDLCGDRKIVGFLNRGDSVIQLFKLSDKLYKVRVGYRRLVHPILQVVRGNVYNSSFSQSVKSSVRQFCFLCKCKSS